MSKSMSQVCGEKVAIALFNASIDTTCWMLGRNDWSNFIQETSKCAVESASSWNKYDPKIYKYDLEIVKSSAEAMAKKLMEVC